MTARIEVSKYLELLVGSSLFCAGQVCPTYWKKSSGQLVFFRNEFLFLKHTFQSHKIMTEK